MIQAIRLNEAKETLASTPPTLRQPVWVTYSYLVTPVAKTKVLSAQIVLHFDRASSSFRESFKVISRGTDYDVNGVDPRDKNPGVPESKPLDVDDLLLSRASAELISKLGESLSSSLVPAAGSAESMESAIAFVAMPSALRSQAVQPPDREALLSSFIQHKRLVRAQRFPFKSAILSSVVGPRAPAPDPAKVDGSSLSNEIIERLATATPEVRAEFLRGKSKDDQARFLEAEAKWRAQAEPALPLLSVEQVAALAKRSTVYIQTDDSCGSGFFVAPDLVATNKHVVRHAAQRVVMMLPSGERTIGRLEYLDRFEDIAFVRLPKSVGVPLALREDPPPAGAEVVAAGFPECGLLGADGSFGVTRGVVSRVYPGEDQLRHDAAINGGNSGGPLLDLKGRVVGINTWKFVKESSEGLAFAIMARAFAAVQPGRSHPPPTSDSIRRIVLAARESLLACRAKAGSPAGVVEIRWWIRSDGTVSRAEAVSKTGSESRATDCILQVIRSLRFQKSGSGEDVEQSMSFRLSGSISEVGDAN